MWKIWLFEASRSECGSAGPQTGARTELGHPCSFCYVQAIVADLVTRNVMMLKDEYYFSL